MINEVDVDSVFIKRSDSRDEPAVFLKKDEVSRLIASRSNVTYNQISDDASAIIATLGTDEYAYFFGQIANKLARIKHGYSVEDSLLDIAGYAKLELDKFREGK